MLRRQRRENTEFILAGLGEKLVAESAVANYAMSSTSMATAESIDLVVDNYTRR